MHGNSERPPPERESAAALEQGDGADREVIEGRESTEIENDYQAAGGAGDMDDDLADYIIDQAFSRYETTPDVNEASPRLIKTSAEFVAGFSPPEYLLDGIMQGGFLYAQTGATGSGKTATGLEFGRCVALGLSIGGREIERGRVIYFAGENPDDVRQRWIGMAEHCGFAVDDIDVGFIDGVIDLQQLRPRIAAEIAATAPARLIIIDTSAAYFLGDDENSNPAMGAYARELRKLTGLPGNPTVLVNCHPIKNASDDKLLPRGGGAFLAELDGNLTCARDGALITVHWQGKFRGADFEPLYFATEKVTAEGLKTAKGKSIATVIARQMTGAQADDRVAEGRQQQDAILGFLIDCAQPQSVASVAKGAGFVNGNGDPQKSTTQRLIDRLAEAKLLLKTGRGVALTDKGKSVAKSLREAARG